MLLESGARHSDRLVIELQSARGYIGCAIHPLADCATGNWRFPLTPSIVRCMLPLSDRLAISRTHLANERTLLAYVRTALALAAGGVGLVQIFTSPTVVALGWALIPASALVLIVGVVRFQRARRALRDAETTAVEGRE